MNQLKRMQYPSDFKIPLFIAALSGFFLLNAYAINAQTAPEFIISWRAVNFIPSDYAGKVLPSSGSPIEVSFDLMDNGKIANLSGNEISWFVNNEVVAQKNGLKSATFTASGNNTQNVRVVVSGYNDSELEKTISIPLADPKIIIDTREPAKYARNRTELPLKNHIFEIRPFFFNVRNLSDLNLKWRLNGELAKTDPENPEFLILDLKSEGTPKQTELSVSASASSKLNILELASETINYLVR